jgi:hypothetical protein
MMTAGTDNRNALGLRERGKRERLRRIKEAARHATEYAPWANKNIIICPSSEVILRSCCSAPGLIRRFGTPTWANGPRERRRRA